MLWTNDDFHFWEPWKWEKDPYWKLPLIMFWCAAIIHFMFYGIYICSQLDLISGVPSSVTCYRRGVCVAVMCCLAWGQMCECTSACISRRWWSSLTPLEPSYLQCRSCLFSLCVFRSVVFTGPFDITLLSDTPVARAMSSAFSPCKVLQDLRTATTGQWSHCKSLRCRGIAEWML